mgnify:CR=1 FL=1
MKTARIIGTGSYLPLTPIDNKQFYEVLDKFKASFPEVRGYEIIMFPREYKFDWMPICYKAKP